MFRKQKETNCLFIERDRKRMSDLFLLNLEMLDLQQGNLVRARFAVWKVTLEQDRQGDRVKCQLGMMLVMGRTRARLDGLEPHIMHASRRHLKLGSMLWMVGIRTDPGI